MMKHMKEPVEVSVIKNTETTNTDTIDNKDNSSFGLNTIFGRPEPKLVDNTSIIKKDDIGESKSVFFI